MASENDAGKPSSLCLSVPSTKAHLNSLRRLTSLLIPIPYPQKFYDELLLPESRSEAVAILAFWKSTVGDPESEQEQSAEEGQVIGGIRARLETSMPHFPGLPYPVDPEKERRLYIATLGVLAPWRGKGIGKMLIDSVVREAQTRISSDRAVVEVVYAHVWEGNPVILEWYVKQGFTEGELIEAYYRRLNPRGARIVWMRVS